uniref:Uncharacterized protein n=1 Tax=Myoviridae sp. ctk251 TaxID=2826689 RepID=A0A8S5MTL9_9CAUD|nr:MAG TPA: hypothetical protein [Myoviridae sp. ctk251]
MHRKLERFRQIRKLERIQRILLLLGEQNERIGKKN